MWWNIYRSSQRQTRDGPFYFWGGRGAVQFLFHPEMFLGQNTLLEFYSLVCKIFLCFVSLRRTCFPIALQKLSLNFGGIWPNQSPPLRNKVAGHLAYDIPLDLNFGRGCMRPRVQNVHPISDQMFFSIFYFRPVPKINTPFQISREIIQHCWPQHSKPMPYFRPKLTKSIPYFRRKWPKSTSHFKPKWR